MLISTTLLLVSAAQAQEVQVDLSQGAAAGFDTAPAETQLVQAADAALKLTNQAAFLDEMAKATALSTRGLGVDYASNPEAFVFGIGFGSAVNAAGAQLGRGELDLPEGGFAGAVSFMAGLNLGMGASEDDAFGKRFRVYAHGMYWTPEYEPFAGTIVNYGGHLQIQVVRPRIGEALEWGGLALTSGYQRTSFSMDLSSPIPIDAGQLVWNADGQYSISSMAESVPIEVSTNLRVLVATAYVGGGADVNLQSAASSELVLTGEIEASNGTVLGSASVTDAAAGAGDFIVPRVFMGLQADLMMIKLFGQLNVGFENSFGGHLGLRVAR